MVTQAESSSFDILAALDVTPSRGERRCKLAKFLDSIAEDTPNKAALVAAVEDPDGYPAQRLTLTFTALGTPIHKDTIGDHRGKRCRCFR